MIKMKVTLSYSPEVKKQLEEKYRPPYHVVLRTSAGNPIKGIPPSITGSSMVSYNPSPFEASLFEANITPTKVTEILDYIRKTSSGCESGEPFELPELSSEEREAVVEGLKRCCEPYDVKITTS